VYHNMRYENPIGKQHKSATVQTEICRYSALLLQSES
ncbi:MAG: hypothetical protein H6Q93_778, partial [Nitrospirae bacterium]|nr:hypothetical protein [Nitrospirota bacterium]